MLKIEHLTKAFGDKLAVDDLTLHIAPGEIYGFIGHNGAGKTTTLRSVAGIQQFDKGEILIAGHSVRTEPLECKRVLAYIPDNPDLYDFMSGIKYLNFIADVFGVGADERFKSVGSERVAHLGVHRPAIFAALVGQEHKICVNAAASEQTELLCYRYNVAVILAADYRKIARKATAPEAALGRKLRLWADKPQALQHAHSIVNFTR